MMLTVLTIHKCVSSELLFLKDEDLLSEPEYIFSINEDSDTTCLKAYLSMTKTSWKRLLLFAGISDEHEMIMSGVRCYVVVKGCVLYLDDIWGENVALQLTFNSERGKVNLFGG